MALLVVVPTAIYTALVDGIRGFVFLMPRPIARRYLAAHPAQPLVDQQVATRRRVAVAAGVWIAVVIVLVCVVRLGVSIVTTADGSSTLLHYTLYEKHPGPVVAGIMAMVLSWSVALVGLHRRVERRDPHLARGTIAVGVLMGMLTILGMYSIGWMLAPFTAALIWIGQPLHQFRQVRLARPHVGVRM